MKVRTLAVLLSLLVAGLAGPPAQAQLTDFEQLGKDLFFDDNLSTPPGQSCAACHAPNTAWTGPVSGINAHGSVYPGAVHTRFGNRKPPTSAYASFSPDFHYDPVEGLYVGGMFWDGRALNTVEQAKGPFLNAVEQNNPNQRSVIIRILKSDYAEDFKALYASWIMDSMAPGDMFPGMDFDVGDDMFIGNAYQFMAEAIAAFEASPEVNRFGSKFDAYWEACLAAGNDCESCGLAEGSKSTLDPGGILTDQEFDGLIEFGEYCSPCHISHEPGPGGTPPLFTDYTYDNIGVPRNPENPWYTMPGGFNPDGADWVDYGLGGRLGIQEELGKMKVPTVRNVGMRPYEGFVQSYMHNGFFKSLEEVVHFYNTRDVEMWPEPEVPVNVNREIFEGVPLGDFRLSAEDEAAIVAFLHTLTDGWTGGMSTPFAPVEVAATLPPIEAGSSPNPFHGATRIRFTVAEPVPVTLSVFDVQGRKVRALLSGARNLAGTQQVVWDSRDDSGRPVSPGVYFYRLQAGGARQTHRVVVLP